MNKNDFRSYFSSSFVDMNDFITNVLSPIFGTFNGNRVPTGNDYVQTYGDGGANISHIYDYGFFDVNGQVSVWEVVLADNCQISRARKNIQTTIRRITEDYTGAFIVFHYANGSPNPEAQTWRLSWLMRTDAQVRTSPAKRYTYLCGPSYSCRTIAERFDALQKEKRKTLDTITKAFDVEALSDEFFKEYKVMYDDIVQWITGQRIIKKDGKWKEEGVLHTGLGNDIYKKFYNAFGKDDIIATKAVRDYVKKLLGRLVFIQFLQKKGCWLKINGNVSTNFLLDVFNQVSTRHQDDFIEKVLEKVVYLLLNNENRLPDSEKIDKLVLDVPFLNGGLFEPDACDDIVVKLPKEFFHNEQYQEVKREQNETRLRENDKFFNQCGILDLFNQYNFTIDENDPNDAEVGVDPEMLGKIFENLLEDNKEKGAFYTPKEIVQYMCNESLIAYLQTKVPNHDDEIRQFVLNFEKESVPEKKKILNAIKDVKICDPAIGSGAFPMGLLNLLVALREKLEPNNNRCNLKKEIIQNNIYGVDIEKGAIDIARLRFWLSIMVDDGGAKPTPLPNFEYKFMQGNSLLTTFDLQYVDIKQAKQNVEITKKINDKKKELLAKKREFYGLSGEEKYKKEVEIKLLIVEILKLRLGFEKDSVGQQDTTRQMLLFAAPDMPTNSRSKKKIQEVKEAQERIKILIDKLLEIERQLNDETKTWEVRAKTDILFFDWEICFAEIFPQDKPESEKGFDIVIANPPYIDSESMVNQGLEWERKVLQKSYSNLSGNWDIYMAFFETALCMAKFVSFITPDKWLSKPFGEKFRANQMLKRLYRITRAGSKVFENATVDAIITFYKEKSSQIEASHFIDRATLETISKADNNDIKAPYLIDFLFSKNATIIHKIDTTIKTYLLNKAECENACATADFYVVKDLIECNKYPDSKLYYKLINTGTIEKYRNKWPDKEITYGGKFKFPVVNKTKFDSQLGKTYKKRAASSKIIFKGLNLLDGCLDENAELLPGKTTLVICSDNIELLKLLLGLLNSKLPLFYIKTKYASSSYCGGISFSPEMINNLPVPIGLCLSHQIIKLVNQILTDKSTNSQVNTSTLELKIDILVYILYGLTYDEVMIVENPSVKKTNKGEKPKQCGKKKDANQVCKLNVDEKIYSKWLERYQKDSILPSEEELDKAIGKTSVPSAAPETAGPSKVIVEYQEPYQSFGPNYGVYLEYNYDTDDLQYSINSRMNTTKELTPAQIETIKSYLRNRQNIEDFFNNAHSTEPVIRSSHYCVHELSIAYGNRKETVENGELMPWAEPFAKLCK